MIEAGDRTKESFQRLVAAELPGLYWLARRLVRDGAEDLVQEALLRAYRSFGALKEDPAAGRWLRSILVNVFRDQLRRQEARSVEELPVEQVEDFSLYRTLVEQDPLPYSDTLHHDFLQAFAREDVREVLLRLPELYRAPLVLRYVDGFATKEIARMLDAPLGTILARLHRAAYLGARDELEPITRQELVRRVSDGEELVVLDVRPAEEHAAGHLPGAVSIPLPDLRRRLAELPRDREIVAYCRGPYCAFAHEAVAVLTDAGLSARRLEDGLPEWQAAGLPVSTGSQEVTA